MKQLLKVSAVLSLILLLSVPAKAYIDPGSGSLFLQGLLFGTGGIVMFMKIFWRRFVRLFLRLRPVSEKGQVGVDGKSTGSARV
jgi:hypothetical protein